MGDIYFTSSCNGCANNNEFRISGKVMFISQFIILAVVCLLLPPLLHEIGHLITVCIGGSDYDWVYSEVWKMHHHSHECNVTSCGRVPHTQSVYSSRPHFVLGFRLFYFILFYIFFLYLLDVYINSWGAGDACHRLNYAVLSVLILWLRTLLIPTQVWNTCTSGLQALQHAFAKLVAIIQPTLSKPRNCSWGTSRPMLGAALERTRLCWPARVLQARWRCPACATQAWPCHLLAPLKHDGAAQLALSGTAISAYTSHGHRKPDRKLVLVSFYSLLTIKSFAWMKALAYSEVGGCEGNVFRSYNKW